MGGGSSDGHIEPYRDATPAVVEKLERTNKELEWEVRNLQKRLNDRTLEELAVYKTSLMVQVPASLGIYMIFAAAADGASHFSWAHPNLAIFMVVVNLCLLAGIRAARKLG